MLKFAVNNIDTSFADEIQNISNGRQIEGSYALAESPGLNSIIDGTFPIANYVDYIASWERTAPKPTLLHVSVNSLIQGGWRVGRWQNLATAGEMMLRLTHFARMRMGLGVALLSDAYFANDIGGGFYGVPSWYTEYECDLGFATHDSSAIYQSPDDPKAQVWSRLFEKGIVVVNRLTSSNFTVKLSRPMNARDGRWQTALSHVRLEFNEFIVEWDSCRGGYAAVDALLVESESLYNGAEGTMTTVTVGAMDSRILLF